MSQAVPAHPIIYSPEIEAEIAHLAAQIAQAPALHTLYDPRWLAIQLLEGEQSLLEGVEPDQAGPVAAAAGQSRQRLRAIHGDDLDIVIAGQRYSFAHAVVAQVLVRPQAGPRLSLSDRLDRLFLHRWLGIPILMALMYLVFNLVHTVSAPYLEWVDGLFGGSLSRWATALLEMVQAPAWVVSLAVDGAIAGVGGVLTFLPGLLVMYLALAFLEDSGYMARAAFVMDRAMGALGLHGKSFIPLILGFGCNVPAIYATRTIENRQARILTGLLVPFMSCSARLPIYVVFGLAFFPRHADLVIWLLYLVGVVVAAAVGIVLSRTLLTGTQSTGMVLEMGPYRLPTLKSLFTYAWRNSAAFVRKAGTVVLAVSMVLWLLMNLPWGVAEPRDSYFGRVSGAVAPVFAPAGFGDWASSGALITGLMAKEVVISTMAQVYAGSGDDSPDPDQLEAAPGFVEDAAGIVVGFTAATLEAARQLLDVVTPGLALFPDAPEPADTALSSALRRAYTPLSALAFLIFVVLYVPCVATIGAQAQEFGWRWALFSVAVTLAVPWLLAVLVFQVGRLLGAA